jgi:hypothetical protein
VVAPDPAEFAKDLDVLGVPLFRLGPGKVVKDRYQAPQPSWPTRTAAGNERAIAGWKPDHVHTLVARSMDTCVTGCSRLPRTECSGHQYSTSNTSELAFLRFDEHPVFGLRVRCCYSSSIKRPGLREGCGPQFRPPG